MSKGFNASMPKTIKAASTEKENLPEKKKMGRPKIKTEETKTINIAVPVSKLEKINIAKMKYNDNLTRYINELIDKDLEENMETYEHIYKLLKQ